MGMPTIPESSLNIELEAAINLVIASIAEEELGLAHIINAEGEKIQAAVAAYSAGDITFEQLLEVNCNVKSMLKQVVKNNIFLDAKLETLLDISKTLNPDT